MQQYPNGGMQGTAKEDHSFCSHSDDIEIQFGS